MASASIQDTRFRLGEATARDLASSYGTPLYVIDEAHFRTRIRRYRSAFEAAYPDSAVAFASKANSTLAVLATAHSEGCLIDVASEGELRAAIAAGVPCGHCHLHGSNKSLRELEFALDSGIGEIVVDSFREIEMLESLAGRIGRTELSIRLAPGVDPVTHDKISTGQADTKFGFNIADGSAEDALARCLRSALPLVGFHCHVGSQLLDPGAQRAGAGAIALFAKKMLRSHGFRAAQLNVGGGLGVRYVDQDRPMEVEEYSRLVVEAVLGELDGTDLRPRLLQEPGRSLVAESGVTLYTVGTIKDVPIGGGRTRTYVSVDGGLADNPRPALYGARYSIVPAGPSPGPETTVTVSGRHCETDLLFPDVGLPAVLAPGDLLQVLCTGAYSSSMASNYNRYPRPATAWIRTDGSLVLVQRAETFEEMLSRESLPPPVKE